MIERSASLPYSNTPIVDLPTGSGGHLPMRRRIDARHRNDTLTRIPTTAHEDTWRRAATQ